MKQTVVSNPTVDGSGRPTTNNNAATNPNGINIPINHQYGGQQQQSFANDTNPPGYSSPSNSRQFPHHFQQGFGFDPDIDGMFSDAGIRSRMGRMHDPFNTFGSRKRCGNEPQSNNYFNDDPDFFPQFGTLGSRRRNGAGSGGNAVPPADSHSDNFFDSFPSEFRQYMPEGFNMGHRRAGSAGPAQYPPMPSMSQHTPQYYQSYGQPNLGSSAAVPQSTKTLCDAAIQTDNPPNDTVDGSKSMQDNLKHNSFRNTVDLGVKSAPEDNSHSARSQSAPPNEPPNGGPRNTIPSQPHRTQFSTQTSSPVNGGQFTQAPYQQSYYPSQSQSHQQSQHTVTPPPTTPGGSYIRTIPIFVEGRSEPVINSHKEIPNQYQTSNNTFSTNEQPGRKYTPPQQQQQTEYQPYHQQKSQQPHHNYQQRPTPLKTQQATDQYQEQKSSQGIPPQTPHTLDSINKIQDIQRDVLELMTQVENFSGIRQDKEYTYLDEMLTRNLLKLDTIDTNGKESIRMARKEAIKCIQASINVLEAKAGENAKTVKVEKEKGDNEVPKSSSTTQISAVLPSAAISEEAQQIDPTKSQEAIPLPPPENLEKKQTCEVIKNQEDIENRAHSNAEKLNTKTE